MKYIKTENPELVSLVAMGLNGKVSADEDILCAEYIENTLSDRPNNFEEITRRLRVTPELQKFFDPETYWFPEKDFKMCLTLNRFNFVLKVKPYDKNLVYFEKVNI